MSELGVMGMLRGLGGAADALVTGLTGSAVLGDLAGAVVNLHTGNLAGGALDLLELVDDLGQAHAQAPACSCPGYHESQPGGRVSLRLSVGTTGAAGSAAAQAPAHLQAGLRAVERQTDVHVSTGGGEVAVEVEVRGWAPAREPETSLAGGLAGTLRGILDDPGLSLEDKVARLLATLLDGLDGEVSEKMDALADAQATRERRDAGGPAGRPAKSTGASAPDTARLSSELQLLMQRRSQLQSLLSNVMGISHQSAMQVISNIR